jgi:hypothetical protein
MSIFFSRVPYASIICNRRARRERSRLSHHRDGAPGVVLTWPGAGPGVGYGWSRSGVGRSGCSVVDRSGGSRVRRPRVPPPKNPRSHLQTPSVDGRRCVIGAPVLSPLTSGCRGRNFARSRSLPLRWVTSACHHGRCPRLAWAISTRRRDSGAARLGNGRRRPH